MTTITSSTVSTKAKRLQPLPAVGAMRPDASDATVQPPCTEAVRDVVQSVGDWMSDHALLAALVGDAHSADQAVAGLLERYPRLSLLCTAPLRELDTIPHLGPLGALRVAAAAELAKRLALPDDRPVDSVRGPEQAAAFIRARTIGETREHFFTLHLDNRNHVRGVDLVSIGDHASTLVHPREVFRNAIRSGAVAIVVGHNHPSGDAEPSAEDIAVTRRLHEAGKILGVPVLDHVIVGGANHTSMRQKGYL